MAIKTLNRYAIKLYYICNMKLNWKASTLVLFTVGMLFSGGCKKTTKSIPNGDRLRIVYYNPYGHLSGWSQLNMQSSNLNNYFERHINNPSGVWDTTIYLNSLDSVFIVNINTEEVGILKTKIYLNDILKKDYSRYWNTKVAIGFDIQIK